MTTRTPMGAQPRPPQRTLSGSSLPGQRPPHQRAISQQYLPPSPIRKETFIDFPDSGDVAQARYANTPRRGGSRLKLELSNESMLPNTSTSESPQTLTPSRIMPMNELPDGSQGSPANMARLGQGGDLDTTPLPMPKRRPRCIRAPTNRPKTTGAPVPTQKKDHRPKPYSIEVPSAAPKYKATKPTVTQPSRELARVSNSGHADFFPWTGGHPEDQFSEAVIRNGYFDKLSSSQAEAGSAKSAVFPLLKQKTGLNALSNVFMCVLGQRRLGGQISSPSTFKPPPRVTLTDTKREMWLKDLANPSISLRRLSRTIPHGIRGKVLLDHCLNKNVPTNRAVWLAKCVGANDLRAFRRKGVNQKFVMGGESKWIKDWTVFVEQFVESVVFSFTSPEWKARVTYAIRLATNLYAEQLLDRDHYMEWLVSGLENSPHTKLPMWLLISEIYWKDLLRLRKTGRRLVAALLNHLSTIHNDPDKDILIQLSSRLTALLVPLMTANSESFVAPLTWQKHRDAVLESIRLGNPAAQPIWQSLNDRNDWLVGANHSSGLGTLQELVKILDQTLQAPYNNAATDTAWSLSVDKAAIVRGVLSWGTSVLRPGRAKVYVTVRLLRAWRKAGLDVTSSVLDFIDSIPQNATEQKQLVYHVVSELVRSSDFGVSRYIQWLITRGGLNEAEDAEPTGLCSTRLLVELPVHVLSHALQNTRANLLRRTFDVEAERVDFETALRLLRHAMGLPLEAGDPVALRKPSTATKLAKPISKSSRALQTRVGAYLRDELFGSVPMNENRLEMSCSNFNFARTILEAANDYEVLLAVVKMATKVPNPELLASCADTINVHLLIFAAIDDARKLFDGLFESLSAISKEQGLAAGRSLLASLASLAERIPGYENRSAQLRNELHLCDRSSAIDACSPVSDNMAGQMDFEGALHEEIEKLLGSGTSVDRPTMDRLFRTVSGRLEACWVQPNETQRAYCSLLTRLRAFDMHHFDDKMMEWLRRIRNSSDRPPLVEILPILMSQGCLKMATVLTATLVDLPPRPLTSRPPHLQEVLQLTILTLPAKTPLTPEESYRFYIQQKTALFRHPAELRSLLLAALTEYCEFGGQMGVTNLPLDSPGCWSGILDLIKHLVLVNPAALSQALASRTMNPNSPISSLIEKLTTQVLAPSGSLEARVSFDQILEMANELSLPFCQIKLSLGLAVDESSGSPHDATESRFALFTRAMDRAIEAKNVMWTSILPHLNDDIAQHLKNEAQSRFLHYIPSTKSAANNDPPFEPALEAAYSLLSIVESITRGHTSPRTAQFTIHMFDKLSDLWEILSSRDEEKKPLKGAVLAHWLPLLLRFVAMHASPSEPTSAPTPSPSSASIKPPINPLQTELRAKVLMSLSGLYLELQDIDPTDPHLSQAPKLAEQVLDVALLLVDNLPEDARAQCCRIVLTPDRTTSLGPASSDPMLQYLFSYTPPTTENLMLAQKDKTTPGAGATAAAAARSVGAMYGMGHPPEKLVPFNYRRWEVLSEPTPNVGENDTSLSLILFEAIKIT